MSPGPGSVVIHKASARRMTVEKIDGHDIHCVWFVGSTLYRRAFHFASVSFAGEVRA